MNLYPILYSRMLIFYEYIIEKKKVVHTCAGEPRVRILPSSTYISARIHVDS
jgi:hypothetical protein